MPSLMEGVRWLQCMNARTKTDCFPSNLCKTSRQGFISTTLNPQIAVFCVRSSVLLCLKNVAFPHLISERFLAKDSYFCGVN